MSVDSYIKDLVQQSVVEALQGYKNDPEWISIDDAATVCKVDRSVIDSLVHESPANGFPAAKLGKKTIRIEKGALTVWMRGGGLLRHGQHQKN